MFLVILLIVVVVIIVGMRKPKPTIRKCFSTSCNYNFNGKCDRQDIDIYDNNGLVGICLWHTNTMDKRVPKIYTQEKKSSCEVPNRFFQTVEEAGDEKAIKNPEVFKLWMQKHGIKKLDLK